MAPGKLYIIATPLGNRNDITLRALAMLKALSCFFAEDTRELAKLLELHGLSAAGKQIHSYANHNMREATNKALRYLEEGTDVGFVSDRGTPGVSDPGPVLANACLERNYSVIPIPGPSSVTSTLSVAGFSADSFCFLGFLPLTLKEREAVWKRIESWDIPVCFFESARRVRATAEEVKTRFPDGQLFFAREITKLHESYARFFLRDLDSESLMERGEYTLVLHPGKAPVAEGNAAWMDEVKSRLAPDKVWAKTVATRHGITASEVYNALQQEKRPQKLSGE